MTIEIKIPSVGESIQEAVLAEWFKQSGDSVLKDEPLFVIETDKVTLEVAAEVDGVLKILVVEGETVAIGAVVGTLEPAAMSDGKKEHPPIESEPVAPAPVEPAPVESKKADIPLEEKEPQPATTPQPVVPDGTDKESMPLSPAVRRLVAEKNIDLSKIARTGPGGRITKGDVLLYLEASLETASTPSVPTGQANVPPVSADTAMEIRKPMSPIRKRIASRLLESKQNTAMLTTFNEIDMSRAMAIRAEYKVPFEKKFGVSLGFMSFFIKACVEALKEIPEINAFIDGDDIIYHQYQHIGVAIGSDRGLVVPVIRHVEKMNFADIEQAIVDLVAKIKKHRLTLADLEGGTFTVSNGGVYGSLLSTPILNMPQSGILGMHKIEKRPVVVDDEIVIRPMMYVALSYDHRIVDGREAVTCLKRIKEFIENPERMILEV